MSYNLRFRDASKGDRNYEWAHNMLDCDAVIFQLLREVPLVSWQL